MKYGPQLYGDCNINHYKDPVVARYVSHSLSVCKPVALKTGASHVLLQLQGTCRVGTYLLVNAGCFPQTIDPY